MATPTTLPVIAQQIADVAGQHNVFHAEFRDEEKSDFAKTIISWGADRRGQLEYTVPYSSVRFFIRFVYNRMNQVNVYGIDAVAHPTANPQMDYAALDAALKALI